MKMLLRTLMRTCVVLGCLGSGPVAAQVDSTATIAAGLPFEAALQHDGAPIADGPVAVRFAIRAADGTEVWAEEHSNLETRSCPEDDCRIEVRQSRIHLVLGRFVALEDILSDPQAYRLGLGIYEGEELRPLTADLPLPTAHVSLFTTQTGSFSTDYLVVAGDADVGGAVRATRFQTQRLAVSDHLQTETISVLEAMSADSIDVRGDAHGSAGIAVTGTVSLNHADGPGGSLFAPASGADTNSASIADGFGPVTIDGAVELASMEIGGSLRTPAGIRSNNWFIEAGEPLIAMSTHSVPAEDGYLFVDRNPNEWMCWVGGFSVDGADLCEFDVESCTDQTYGSCSTDSNCDTRGIGRCIDNQCHYSPLSAAYLVTQPNQYVIRANASGGGFGSLVTLVCARTRASNWRCADGTGWVNDDCEGDMNPGGNINNTQLTYVQRGFWPVNWPAAFGQ